MRELTKAMVRLSWAMPLYAMKQMAELATSPREWMRPDKAGRSFGFLRHVPGAWSAWTLAMMEGSAAVFKHVPGQHRSGQELENKVRAFSGFRRAGRWLRGDLRRSVERLVHLDPYDRLWALEGIAYALGERSRIGTPRRRLLADAPEAFDPAFHPGLGMSFASHALAAPGPLRARLERFLDLCRDHAARPGWERAMVDALGLAARTSRPNLLGELERELERRDADLVPFFRHGVGRGLYFVTVELAPGAAQPADGGSLDALRGLAWAVTLVNVRHPEIVEAARRERRLDSAGEEAWADGLAHALLLYRTVIGRRAPGFERWPEAPGPAGPEMYRRSAP